MEANARRQRRRLRSWALIILVLAVVPNVTFMGHWPVANAAAAPVVHHQGFADDHAAHCHTGSAECSQQAMTGSIWIGEDAELLSLNAPYRSDEGAEIAYPVDAPAYRLLQPPQPLV